MNLDVGLITKELLAELDKEQLVSKSQAEGVRMLYERIRDAAARQVQTEYQTVNTSGSMPTPEYVEQVNNRGE